MLGTSLLKISVVRDTEPRLILTFANITDYPMTRKRGVMVGRKEKYRQGMGKRERLSW